MTNATKERNAAQKGETMSVDTELKRHREDWEGFMHLTMTVGAGVALLLILMAIFLVKSH